MKALIIVLGVFISMCVFLTACGRKLPPKPAEGSEITYPGSYPKPD